MANITKKANARKSAKSASAEKRKTQIKKTKASKGKCVKPTLAATRSKRSGQTSDSTACARQRSQSSKSTPGANKLRQQAAPKNSKEKQSILKRLIETLKRIIGYKKGERDEFRYNYDERHPGYIFKEEQGKLKSFGVTHSDVTFGKKNMPLEENPDPKDNHSAYIRNGVITSKKKRNSGRIKNMKLSQQDKARVKSKKRNYKKIAKQQNKKSK